MGVGVVGHHHPHHHHSNHLRGSSACCGLASYLLAAIPAFIIGLNIGRGEAELRAWTPYLLSSSSSISSSSCCLCAGVALQQEQEHQEEEHLLLQEGTTSSIPTNAAIIALSSSKKVSANNRDDNDGNNTHHKKPDASSAPYGLTKLRQQLLPGQEEGFLQRLLSSKEEESRKHHPPPLYIDIGLNSGEDTAMHLSRGYSVIAVDAYSPWIEKAKTRHATEIAQNRLWLFNVGVAIAAMLPSPDDDTSHGSIIDDNDENNKKQENEKQQPTTEHNDDVMPLYYEAEGSPRASFVRSKGCPSYATSHAAPCLHRDVQVVECSAILELIDGRRADLMKVDIEMLHHVCVRALHKLPSRLLPKVVCWEEHDRRFGTAEIERPLTDAKLVLGMYELGYDRIKIVMQGKNAPAFYNLTLAEVGHGSTSGTLTPEEMMHYRAYQDHPDGSFDTRWRPVHQVFSEGFFATPPHPNNEKQPHAFTKHSYFDICMKLLPNRDAATKRTVRREPQNFPLASYHQYYYAKNRR